MIYSLSDDILLHTDAQNTDLIDKIWVNSKDRHLLYIGTHQNFDNIQKSDWYQHLRPSSKEQIELSFVESFNLSKEKNIILISNQNSPTTFSLFEAFEILSKPLIVILENIEYDKYFLDSLILNFKELGTKIRKYYDNGWITYMNGGGNNIANVINTMKDRFEKNKAVFPKDSSKYLKAFVIIDSDKKFPSEREVADDKIGLLKLIKENLKYHVTLKREMENYLPDEIISEIPKNEDYKRAYLRLTSEQKDFFDLQEGFPDKNFNDLENEIKNLYNSVQEEDRKVFRKTRLEFYKENDKKDNFKPRFAKLFESKNITRKNLEARANSNELEIILQKINELL